MKKHYYRIVKVFDKNDLQLGKVMIYLYEPDAFNWEKCKEKGIRVLP
jgi:hypothetical protein